MRKLDMDFYQCGMEGFVVQLPVGHLHIALLNHNRQTGKSTVARNLAAANALFACPSLLVSNEDPNLETLEIFHRNDKTLLAEDIEIPSLFYLYLNRESHGLQTDYATLQTELKHALHFIPEVRQIIWDTPSALSSITRAMLRFAHVILVPFKVEEKSFERLAQTLGLLERIQRRESPDLLYWGLLPVFIKPAQRFSELFSGLALPLFKTRMIPVPIPEDPALARAHEEGRSVFSEDILSTGAVAFKIFSGWIEKSFSNTNKIKRLA